MAEPALSLGYADFQQQVGLFLGFGAIPGNFTTDEDTTVDIIIKRGYSQFLYNAKAPDDTENHRWSFMNPAGTIATVAGQEDYDLPDDFTSLYGDIFFTSTTQTNRKIEERSVQDILNFRAGITSSSGNPLYYAINSKAFTGTTSARWQLMLFPTPGSVETLTYLYQVHVPMLSDAKPYPVAPTQLHNVILESMLSVAEIDMNDAPGVHTQNYQQMLFTAVSEDRSKNKPMKLGPMRDCSDLYDQSYAPVNRYTTVYGVLP